MKWVAFLLSVAFFAALFGTPADAWFRHGAAAASCPQATDNGCAAAAANGSFKNASLLTSAQQSGQTSLLPTRAGGSLTLNIPGVDYGVGPASTLTPQDPRTISDSICHYTNTVIPGVDIVLCYGSGVLTETLNNYDFSGTKIGMGPVLLYLDKTPSTPSVGSVITLTNDYFALQSGGGGAGNGLSYCVGVAQNWSVVFKNSQCDGTNSDLSSDFPFRIDSDSTGTSLDIEYSAFTNMGVGRVIGNGHNINTTIKYSFIQGLNDNQNDGNHGEVELRSCNIGGCSFSVDYEGNFIIWNARNNGSTTQTNATFFPSTGSSNEIAITAMTIKDNVVVTNTQGTPPTPTSFHIMGQALFGQRAGTLGVVTITGNWVDATGATGCGVSGVVSGGNSVTASTSGNTLTVTGTSSSFNNNPIDIGWQIFHSGFVTASITAFGTGGGNLGTYTFNGSPQTLGSDSNWTIVPGYTSATLTNNWNLADPSNTGSPAAIGFTAPTMRETTCNTLAN